MVLDADADRCSLFFCFLAALLLSEAVFLSGRKKCEIMLTFFFAAVYAALRKMYIEPHIF